MSVTIQFDLSSTRGQHLQSDLSISICKCCCPCGTHCLAGQLIYTPISIECHVVLLIHQLECLLGNSTGVILEKWGLRPHVAVLFPDWHRGSGW